MYYIGLCERRTMHFNNIDYEDVEKNNNLKLLEENMKIKVIRGKRYSPVLSKENLLDEAALEIAFIIEETGRQPLQFNDFIVSYDLENGTQFIPPCHIDKSTGKTPFLIDMKSSSKQSGQIDQKTLKEVLHTKSICQECPLQKECLATSMTGIQLARSSEKERTIPNSDPSLVINEYLISGGFTPQERGIIFEKLCNILEDWDNIHD